MVVVFRRALDLVSASIVNSFCTRVLSIVLLVFAASCETGTLPPEIESSPPVLRIDVPASRLDRGDTTRLTALLVNSGGPSYSSAGTSQASEVRWTSSDPSIATVSRSGLFLAQRDGRVTITATSGTLTSSSTLSVSPKGKNLIVSPRVDSIFSVGHSLQLSTVVLNGGGKEMPNAGVTWSTLHPSVAQVDTSGIVTAVGLGTALVVAASQNLADTATVVVTQSSATTPAVAIVQIDPHDVEVEVSDTVRFSAVVKDESGKPVPAADLVWSSSDHSVATVNANGLVTTRSRGEATIRATADGRSGTAALSVVDDDASTTPVVSSVWVSPEEASASVGDAVRFTATARDPSGAEVTGVTFQWSSTDPTIASVDTAGVVTPRKPGAVNIYAGAQGKSGAAFLNVLEGTSDPPSVASIRVSPDAATVGVGDTLRFQAVALDADGKAIEGVTVNWSTASHTVASVDATGLVTAKAEGTAQIAATAGDRTGTATLTVDDDVADPAGPEPPAGEWDRVLADTTIHGDVVVPDGDRWLIGRNVRIAGNLRTNAGTIAMRPGSSLHFLGADPARYVGGGMEYRSEFANDIGLWIGRQGVLDIRGTPKTGWNRTGTDPTWDPNDEYWIAPTDAGDVQPRRWYPGERIPRIDPRVPAAEVMNVTRDVVIEGPGHIHIHSLKPQRIEYVRLERMGILKPGIGTNDGALTGRYALHLHHMEEGARGTVVRGVAAVNSGGRVYVPHMSHGITFEDVVSVNSMAEAFWWDPGDRTNDLVVNRLAASGVYAPREYTGENNRYNVVELPFGLNMTMRNSAASGGANGRLSVGFNWNAGNRRDDTHWTFENNVAHNNGTGIRFWNNSGQPHHIVSNITYRNATGVQNGAYNNSNRYTDLLMIDDTFEQHASSNEHKVDSGPARLERVHVEALDGPALHVTGRNLEAKTFVEIVDSEFHTAGSAPKVLVGANANPWFAEFIGTNVLPEDIEWDLSNGRNEGSDVRIEHRDGRRWRIQVINGQIKVQSM